MLSGRPQRESIFFSLPTIPKEKKSSIQFNNNEFNFIVLT